MGRPAPDIIPSLRRERSVNGRERVEELAEVDVLAVSQISARELRSNQGGDVIDEYQAGGMSTRPHVFPKTAVYFPLESSWRERYEILTSKGFIFHLQNDAHNPMSGLVTTTRGKSVSSFFPFRPSMGECTHLVVNARYNRRSLVSHTTVFGVVSFHLPSSLPHFIPLRHPCPAFRVSIPPLPLTPSPSHPLSLKSLDSLSQHSLKPPQHRPRMSR